MREQSVIPVSVSATAAGVFAPGHLGELTQVIDFELVDEVLAECGAVEQRLRLLPSRVVVYFVLALALFESCSYRATWGKLTAALSGWTPVVPAASSLARARRRVGATPLRALFQTVAGPVAPRGHAASFYRGLRTVAVDGTHLHVPDLEQITWRFPKRQVGELREFGYPLLRLLVIVECGTRALLAAAFGPESDGELVYAGRLLGVLDAGMLLLADAAFDAIGFLTEVSATGAQFLVRSSASRAPTLTGRLPDGSYLARINGAWVPGAGWPVLSVRVVEAWITVTLADGGSRVEPWRLLTSLTDHRRYPATELIELYHRRWQAETTYLSIKATMLDGRVLRSRSIGGIEQEVWALLTAYQALIRIAADAAITQPGLSMERISFTVLLTAAGDQVITAGAISANQADPLLGPIGIAALASLLPVMKRQRIKARSKKNPASKYSPNAGQHPQQTQNYTFEARIEIMPNGLASRQRR